MKHRYRLLFIGIVVILLIVSNQIHFQRSSFGTNVKNPVYNSIDSSFHSEGQLSNITGILLLGPNNNHRNKRSQTLGQNNTFLYGWIYDITYNSVINWLNRQPFPITMIVENAKYQQYADDFATLQNKLTSPTITLLKDQNLGINLTHAKTFVGNKRRAIQTANLNRTSFVDNRESFFLSNNEQIRKDLVKLFELDSKKIANPDSVSASDYQQFVDEISANLVICPLNCRETIENQLKNAQSRIRISAQYVMDKRILNILIKQKHLDIRIRTNKMDSNRDLIRAIGQDHIIWEDKIYNHDKMLLIDDTLIIGSMNLSDNALDNNREIGIILTDPSFIQQVEPLFQNQKFEK